MTTASERGRNNKRRGKALERNVRDLIVKLGGGIAKRIIDQGTSMPDVQWDADYCLLCTQALPFPDESVQRDGAVAPLVVPTEEPSLYIIEVKSRQTAPPAYLVKGWQQAIHGAGLTNRRPLVILSYVEEGRRNYWMVQKLESGKDEADGQGI